MSVSVTEGSREDEGNAHVADEGELDHLTMDSVDRQAVGKVARYVELIDVRAAALGAVVAPHYVFDEPVPPSWHEDVIVGFDTHPLDRSEDEPRRFRVMAYFFAHFDRDWLQLDREDITGPPEGRPVDIDIDARFILEYELDEDCGLTDEELRHFALFNGTFNAWPYWREYAQSASVRLGLSPALIVPVFRIPRV